MNARDEYGKAAAWFTAIMTLVGGAAGLAVAGLIVGFDYAVRGEPEQRERAAAERAARRRSRYDEALTWLETDRADRAARRRAYTEWMSRDPATRGDAPARATSESLGHMAAWAVNSAIVGAGRFARGYRAGYVAAEQRRRNGQQRWWIPQNNAPKSKSEPAPSPQTDSSPRNPSAPNTDADDNIVDAEIIDDPQPAIRPVAVVGDDPPRDGDLGVATYDDRLAALEREVAELRNRRVDPSPPTAAISN